MDMVLVTGLTMDENQMKIWSLCAGTCSDFVDKSGEMMGGSDNVKENTTHKEKAPSHIASDKNTE